MNTEIKVIPGVLINKECKVCKKIHTGIPMTFKLSTLDDVELYYFDCDCGNSLVLRSDIVKAQLLNNCWGHLDTRNNDEK